MIRGEKDNYLLSTSLTFLHLVKKKVREFPVVNYFDSMEISKENRFATNDRKPKSRESTNKSNSRDDFRSSVAYIYARVFLLPFSSAE